MSYIRAKTALNCQAISPASFFHLKKQSYTVDSTVLIVTLILICIWKSKGSKVVKNNIGEIKTYLEEALDLIFGLTVEQQQSRQYGIEERTDKRNRTECRSKASHVWLTGLNTGVKEAQWSKGSLFNK